MRPHCNKAAMEEAEAERIVQELLSEVLRCQIFYLQAKQVLKEIEKLDAVILPRPPELLDIAFAVEESKSGKQDVLIVYPDPPLDIIEQNILRAINSSIDFKTLSELI